MDLNLILTPPLDKRHQMLALCEKDGTHLVCISYLTVQETQKVLRFLRFRDYFDEILYPERRAEDFALHLDMFMNPDCLWITEPKHAIYEYVRPHLHKTHQRAIHRAIGFLTPDVT